MSLSRWRLLFLCSAAALVFVHVNGDRATADTVSMSGEVWDSFVLTGEPFGPTEAAAPATATPSP